MREDRCAAQISGWRFFAMGRAGRLRVVDDHKFGVEGQALGVFSLYTEDFEWRGSG